MEFDKIKLDHINEKIQVVLFDYEGLLISSCNSIVKVPQNSVSLFESTAFLNSLQHLLFQLEHEEKLEFPSVEFDFFSQKGIFQIVFIHDAERKLFTMLIEDRSKFFENLRDVQQERNEFSIEAELINHKNKALLLEKELINAKNEELEKIQKYKSEFFSKISHELRTPINGIIGLSNLISENKENNSHLKYISALKSSADHLSNILNDVLDLSKIEANKFQLHNKPVNLREIVEEVVLSFQYQAKKKGLDLRYKLDENLPNQVNIDPVRLKQIIFNLMSNAFKYTVKGFVEISVKAGYLTKDKQEIKFAVEDSGIGISKENISSIFDEYAQDNKQKNAGHKGTGLGLSVVKNLVELYEGEVFVESEVNKGSCFSFHISLEVVNTSLEEKQERQISIDNLKILIVEDDLINRMVIEKYLWSENNIIHSCSNGMEALLQLDEYQYHIIITDNYMPELNGLQLIKLIRGNNAETPIILLTGDTISNAPDFCRKHKINQILVKPIERQILLETVDRLVNL